MMYACMKQTIRLTCETELPLKEIIGEALANEIRLAETGVRKLMSHLGEFETNYRMRSEQFEEKYRAGELEENPDWEGWLAGIAALDMLIEQNEALKGIVIEEVV